MSPITVLVLRSHIGGTRTWSVLQRYWQRYGSHELRVVMLMNVSFSFADLVEVHPDVIICSDTAGCPSFFSVEEVVALKRYILRVPCCHLLGTYAVFYHVEANGALVRHFDNRQIAPLFGLDERQTYVSTRTANPVITCVNGPHAGRLWPRLSPEHRLLGYQSTKVPSGGRWVVDGRVVGGLSGVRVVACDAEQRVVVLWYRGAYHTSLYISGMPEYQAARVDADYQLIYNCIVALYLDGVTEKLQTLGVRHVSDAAETYVRLLIDERRIESVPFPLALELLRVVLAQCRLTTAQCGYLETVGFGDVSRVATAGRKLGSPQVGAASKE